MHRYFLKYDGEAEKEVTKAEWVMEERMCGFHNTMNQPREPATGGFSWSKRGKRVSGRIETDVKQLIEEMEAQIAAEKGLTQD